MAHTKRDRNNATRKLGTFWNGFRNNHNTEALLFIKTIWIQKCKVIFVLRRFNLKKKGWPKKPSMNTGNSQFWKSPICKTIKFTPQMCFHCSCCIPLRLWCEGNILGICESIFSSPKHWGGTTLNRWVGTRRARHLAQGRTVMSHTVFTCPAKLSWGCTESNSGIVLTYTEFPRNVIAM